MASEYQIDFTDENLNRSFKLSPYTTNGPLNPTSPALDNSAVGAATSLLLYGRGKANYGERILENMVHLLENFSGEDEPVSPISGQLWFARNVSPNQLNVFDNKKHVITSVNVGLSTITISGDHTARLTALAGRGVKIRIISAAGVGSEEFLDLVIGTSTLVGPDTEIVVAPGITAAHLGWYVGGWNTIHQGNTPVQENFDLLDTYYIINPADPTSGSHVGDRDYNDSRYVEIAGDTMTGFLTLSSDPTANLHAATKQYVDNEIISSLAGSGFVSKAGDTMTGLLTLSGAPTTPYHATTKDYVDGQIASVVAGTAVNIGDLNDVTLTSPINGDILVYNFTSSLWENGSPTSAGLLPLTGGTMTGFITLHADPSADYHATTKKYVDDLIDSVTGGTMGVITSGSFDSGTGILTLYRSTGATFDVPGFGSGGGGGESIDVTHLNNPNYQESITGDWIENQFYDQPSFPTLKTSDLIQRFSEIIELSVMENGRVVISASGGATEVFNIHDGTMTYLPGYNHLFLYVNGIKYVANIRGFQEIEHDGGHVSATQGEGFFTALYTGLSNDATIYSMTVAVDGGGPIAVNVAGQDAQTCVELVNQINIDLGTSAKAVILDQRIIIYSATSGSSSSISITDTNLVSNLTGEDTSGVIAWNSGTSYVASNTASYGGNFYIALRSNLNSQPDVARDNWRIMMEFVPSIAGAVGGVTYGYSEDGQYGDYSDQITFEAASIPSVGSVIEAITIQPQLQYQ